MRELGADGARSLSVAVRVRKLAPVHSAFHAYLQGAEHSHLRPQHSRPFSLEEPADVCLDNYGRTPLSSRHSPSRMRKTWAVGD